MNPIAKPTESLENHNRRIILASDETTELDVSPQVDKGVFTERKGKRYFKLLAKKATWRIR